MRLALDEEEQAHLYSCLLAGGKVWAQMKKGREKLELPTTQEDREMELNAKLRMQLNPKAEEIARERERKDPAQQDFTAGEGVSSGETGGGHPPGETFKTKLRLNGEDVMPTDANMRDALLKHGRMVLLSDIAEWTAEDRQAVVEWVSTHQSWLDADLKGAEPDEPDCLALVALSEGRLVELVHAGPYVDDENFEKEEDEEPKSVTVRIPAKGEEGKEGYRPEVLFGEFEDAVDAQIKTARLNQAFQRSGDMAPEDVLRWLHTGPWKAGSSEDESRWFAVHAESAQEERVPDEETAKGTAARYNRTLAGDGAEPTLTLVQAQMKDEGWERDDEALVTMLGLVVDFDKIADRRKLAFEDLVKSIEKDIAEWSAEDAYLVEKWAGAVHLRAGDHDDVDVPATPAVIVAIDPDLERAASLGKKQDDDDEDGGWMTHKDDSSELWDSSDDSDEDEEKESAAVDVEK